MRILLFNTIFENTHNFITDIYIINYLINRVFLLTFTRYLL